MRVVLKHPADLSEAELFAWRRMRASDARWANPFLSPGFALAAGAARADARVLLGHDDAGAIALILPLQVASSGLARPLGAPMCDVNGPLTAANLKDFDLPQILTRAGLSAFAFSGWANGAAHVGERGRIRGLAREGCAVADLGGGFEAWLETQRDLHAKHFKKMRRLSRQGERDFGAMTVRLGPARASEMETLIAWKRAQFARTRRHDILKPEWTRTLLHRCADAGGEDFCGVMATLHLGGKLAAAEFGLRSGDILHGWFAGYDPDFSSCSPGLILQEKLLEAAAAAGVRHAVLGVGEMHYKHYYTSWQAPLDGGVIAASGLAGRARGMTGDIWRRVETGGGGASRLALRTRRRLDVILAVETRAGDQIGGFLKAVGEEPAVKGAAAAMGALATAAPQV